AQFEKDKTKDADVLNDAFRDVSDLPRQLSYRYREGKPKLVAFAPVRGKAPTPEKKQEAKTALRSLVKYAFEKTASYEIDKIQYTTMEDDEITQLVEATEIVWEEPAAIDPKLLQEIRDKVAAIEKLLGTLDEKAQAIDKRLVEVEKAQKAIL